VSAERPPDEGDREGELTSGDPLDAARDRPAPPPWARPEPAEPASPPPSWRPYDDEPTEAEPPPPPWASDPAPQEPTEAQRAFGTEEPATAADAFGLPEERVREPDPEPEPEPEPEPLPPPPPPQPRTGSIGPPGYASSPGPETTGYGDRPIPPGAGLPPRPPVAAVRASAPGERRALASWGRRVIAYLLDAIIIGVVVTLLIVIITGASGGVGFLGGDATGYGALLLGLLFSTLIATAVALFYAPFYMARTNGQTLGKQLMGIRVVRADGRPVDFLWSVWREVVVKAFLFAGLGGSITFGLAWLVDGLWPLWDDENRALHDLIVNSRVVKA
jgi:uncharacterized RDD family membrane protein YckC